jgi:hypothetical protein
MNMQPMSFWQLFLSNPEWALVIVGILTMFVIGWQAVETRRAAQASKQSIGVMERQTKATEDAAKAAQASADAMINSERAWVIVELVPICRQFGKWWHRPAGDRWAELSEEEVVKGEHRKYKFKFTDMGRGPAQILGFTFIYTCLGKGVIDLPESGAGERALKSYRPFEQLLGGNEKSIEIEEIIDMNLYMRDDFPAIKRLDKTAVIHGWVKYRHMLSTVDDCYADFCYVYAVSQDRLTTVGRHTKQRQQKAI